jgi:hypothetical protein
MEFVANEIYVDREGVEYRYLERRSGVQVFESVETNQRLVLNSQGRFRWDNQDHPRDIIGKK